MRRTFQVRLLSSLEGAGGWKRAKGSNGPQDLSIALEYLPKILTSQVYDVAMDTPLTKATSLSSMLGNNVRLDLYCKTSVSRLIAVLCRCF